jgi:hypothetical protein
MANSLLDSFRALDKVTKDALADISSPRALAFITLHLANKNFNIDSLSAEHIVACLESAGVATTKNSIGRALAPAKGFVTRTISEEGEVFYRLMTKGEREAETSLNAGSGLTVLRIESGKPRQARIKLGEILKSLAGTIRICDPYYGVSTLDSLDYIPKTCDVRFLTQKTQDSPRKISGALRDYYKEKPSTQFRTAKSSARLHDRFILTKDELLILGHGIKDIGNKESFVIALEKQLVPDIIDDVQTIFDKEWALATPI